MGTCAKCSKHIPTEGDAYYECGCRGGSIFCIECGEAEDGKCCYCKNKLTLHSKK